MSVVTDLTHKPIAERTTRKITFLVVDEDGVAVPGASLTTLTLTLYDEITEAIINTVDDKDILNVGGGLVDGSGNGSYTMDPADNQIVGTASFEDHIALFEWTYGGGAKAGKEEVRLRVDNFSKVT